MTFRHSPTLILALALLTRLAPAIPAQDSTLTVRDLVAQGMTEYSKQHWEAARTAFLKAWDLNEHYAIAGSLADVEMKLGRYREAAEHLKYALANLPAERAEKRAEAEAHLRECRAHVSTLRVSVDGMLVLVQLDGQALPHFRLQDELFLDPGPHQLEAEEQGYQPWSREFTAEAGETREIRVELTPMATPAAAPPRAMNPQSPVSSGFSSRTWVLIGGGAATAIAAGVGTVFALRYHSLGSEADNLLAQTRMEGSPDFVAHDAQCADTAPMRPAACDELADTMDSRNSAGKIANASFITAGVLGVATVVTYVLWPKKSEAAEKSGRVSITPWLTGARGGALGFAF